MSIKTALLPVAGFGTRLLPASKEIPKEMFPVLTYYHGEIRPIPVIQVIYEILYDAGVREFYFVISRGKEHIARYFTPHMEFVDMLRNRLGKDREAEMLEVFYKKLFDTKITFIYQHIQKGFGDAVLHAKNHITNSFVLNAGDDLILMPSENPIKYLIDIFEEYDADIALYIEEVNNPRHYGVVDGKEVSDKVYEIKKIIEKPIHPPTNLAVVAIYIFKPLIFTALEEVSRYEGWELVDAVQYMIDKGYKVIGVKLDNAKRLDTGRPEKYYQTLTELYKEKLSFIEY